MPAEATPHICRISPALRFMILAMIMIALFCLCLCTGAVPIGAREVLAVLAGEGSEMARNIVLEARLPMTVTACCCGMALSVAGLLLQTTFRNPLAGPSILGVSTGASLGVAIIMMGAGGWLTSIFGVTTGSRIAIISGAALGAGGVIMILLAFSQSVKSATMLLIVGIMIGYLASALVSWLNFFAPAQTVKDFSIWGMGSFMGVTGSDLPLFSILSLIISISSLSLIKPLNAMLLGDRYAASLGYNPKSVRTILLLCSGALTAIATAFCGPVGFIGLAVPHMARIFFSTSHHAVLLPATIIMGGAVGLLCAWMCVCPSSIGVLPLGAVTPVIGVPVIIYVIIARKRLNYFN